MIFCPHPPPSPIPYTFTLSYLTFRLNLLTSSKVFLLFCVATKQPCDLYLYNFILRLILIYYIFADIWSTKKISVPSIFQYFIYRLNLFWYKEKFSPYPSFYTNWNLSIFLCFFFLSRMPNPTPIIYIWCYKEFKSLNITTKLSPVFLINQNGLTKLLPFFNIIFDKPLVQVWFDDLAFIRIGFSNHPPIHLPWLHEKVLK